MNNEIDNSTQSQENQDEAVFKKEAADESQPTEQQKTSEQPQQEKSLDESEASEAPEKTWHNKNALRRGIAMLGFGFIAGFVRVGITLIAVFQFFCLLFAEEANQPLVKFGQNLNTFLYQINQFLTINSEMYPFPFADWPDSSAKDN